VNRRSTVNAQKVVRDKPKETEAERRARAAKKAADSPAKALEDRWREVVGERHGRVPGIKWGTPERELAKKLFAKDGDGGDEMSFDDAAKLVRHFVDVWCPARETFPTFKLFWTVRGQLHAEMVGAIKKQESRKDRIDAMEFKPEDAKKFPKFGW
jgi:hypothetical protein